MYLARNRAFARAALLGNPSDGYGGRTISISVRNYSAEVVLYEWDSVDIVLAENDRARFDSIQELAKDVRLHGYYGGIRLIKATIKQFVEYCEKRRLPLHDRKFSVRYESDIPRQVGLAGSSAIIVATLRCLMEFYEIQIPTEVQPSFVLNVEQNELGITVGLQDRVIQVYEGLVYMDFDPAHLRVVDEHSCYLYERLDPARLPTLYVAHHESLGEPTEVFHNRVRERLTQGDEDVVTAIRNCADLAARGRKALAAGAYRLFGELMDVNFDNRRRMAQLPMWQVDMVEKARECGATANFAGSGGAIVGAYEGEAMLERLSRTLETIQSRTVKPLIIESGQPVA